MERHRNYSSVLSFLSLDTDIGSTIATYPGRLMSPTASIAGQFSFMVVSGMGIGNASEQQCRSEIENSGSRSFRRTARETFVCKRSC